MDSGATAGRSWWYATTALQLASTLVNSAGCPIKLGSGDLYYCSRRLGVGAIPGSDGQCGPNNGPQCSDCRGFTRTSLTKRANASARRKGGVPSAGGAQSILESEASPKSDESLIKLTSDGVVERAMLLLRQLPEAEEATTPRGGAALASKQSSPSSSRQSAPTAAKRRWALLAETAVFNSKKPKDEQGSTSTNVGEEISKTNSGGAGAITDGSGSSFSVSRRFGSRMASVVSSALALHKLKSARETGSGKSGESLVKTATVSELVLQFVQSSMKVDHLIEVNVLRSRRATMRTKGLQILFESLSVECATSFPCVWVAKTFAAALRKGFVQLSGGIEAGGVGAAAGAAVGPTESSAHFTTAVQGCSPKVHALLLSSVRDVFAKFVQIAHTAMGLNVGRSLDASALASLPG